LFIFLFIVLLQKIISAPPITASSSIYAMRFGVKEYLSGLQCGSMDVIDMGLYSGGTAYRTLIEWICGVSVFHPKAAARLKGIKNDLAGVTVTTTTSTP